MKNHRNSNAFTLIELLVVITNIAILASLVFTGMAKARATANQNTSMNNLRQWGVAFNGSLTDFDNRRTQCEMGKQEKADDAKASKRTHFGMRGIFTSWVGMKSAI